MLGQKERQNLGRSFLPRLQLKTNRNGMSVWGRAEPGDMLMHSILEEKSLLWYPLVVVLVAPSTPTLSMEFPRQEYWSGLPFPSTGDIPDPEIEPGSPALQVDFLSSEPPGKPKPCP